MSIGKEKKRTDISHSTPNFIYKGEDRIKKTGIYRFEEREFIKGDACVLLAAICALQYNMIIYVIHIMQWHFWQ